MSLGPDGVAHRRTGIEHEFVVRRGETAVDFRPYARDGRLPGRRLDADDPHAHRQRDGGVITADGAEAEIATHPHPLCYGFSDTLHRRVERLHHDLDATIASEMLTTHGVSTHLNVEVPDAASRGAAIRFVHRHAAAMMLLLDRVESPGLLVRPRRGRLEIGGEYAVGGQLKGALVVAAAATIDAEQPGFVPPRSHPQIEPAQMRFGWYVDRQAFGPDLYRDGRAARIGRLTAQDLLEGSWTRCRRHVEHLVSPAELRRVDDLVSGDRPLPCEEPEQAALPVREVRTEGALSPVDLTFDRVLGPVSVRPLMATWDHLTFAVVGHGQARYVALPNMAAEIWLGRFCAGALTAWCLDLLSVPVSSLPVLASVDDVGSGRAFGSVAAGASLSRDERDPVTGLVGGGHPGDVRRHKYDQQEGNPPTGPRLVTVVGPLRRWWPAAAGAAAVLLVIFAAFALTRGGRDPAPAASSGPTQQLPSSSIPTPEPKIDEALARSLVGTYDVTTVVTKGNGSLTVGMTAHGVMKLKLDCSSANRCTVATSNTPASLSNGLLRFEGNPTEPCPDQSGGTAKDHYVIELTPHARKGTVSRLVGTELLESIDVSECDDVAKKPVTFSWVGVRR